MISQIPPGLDRCQILELLRLNGAAWATPSSAINTMGDSAVFTDVNAIAQMRGFQMETADSLKNGSLLKETVTPGDYATLRIGPNKKAAGATVNSALHLRANGDLAAYGGDAANAEFGGFSITRGAGQNNAVTYTLWCSPTTHASALHRFVTHNLGTASENLIMTLDGGAITFYKAQTTVSDVSTKYNITDLVDSESFDKVMLINPISFVRNGNPPEDVELGFSANDIKDIEERVTRAINTEAGTIHTLSMDGVVSLLLGAVKHLAGRVAALEAA